MRSLLIFAFLLAFTGEILDPSCPFVRIASHRLKSTLRMKRMPHSKHRTPASNVLRSSTQYAIIQMHLRIPVPCRIRAARRLEVGQYRAAYSRLIFHPPIIG